MVLINLEYLQFMLAPLRYTDFCTSTKRCCWSCQRMSVAGFINLLQNSQTPFWDNYQELFIYRLKGRVPKTKYLFIMFIIEGKKANYLLLESVCEGENSTVPDNKDEQNLLSYFSVADTIRCYLIILTTLSRSYDLTFEHQMKLRLYSMEVVIFK